MLVWSWLHRTAKTGGWGTGLRLFEVSSTEAAFQNHLGAATRDEATPRLVLVDLARVAAILFMIQGHSLDVLLAPAYRHGVFFDTWLFLRGLTAPLFFILSGVSFTVSSMSNWERYSRLSAKVFRRLRRFVFFVGLGYAMHLPSASLRGFQYVDAADWQAWFQVDVLQCIGLTLICLQIMALLVGSPGRLAQSSAVAGSAIIFLTPVVWSVDCTKLFPAPIAPYFTSQTGSYFPLFPWAGYVLFGAALGYQLRQWFLLPGKPMRLLAASGAVLGVSGLFLIEPLMLLYINLDFWKTSPSLFLLRAGCVCFLLAFFAWLTARFKVPQRACRALAQESLLIYFVHLCIVYGSIWNPGLRQTVGATLAPLPTLGGICLLLLLMMLLGWAWNSFKRAEPRRSYLLRFAVLLLAIYRPWS
jgi:uncharacterized membrane protein